MYNKYKWYKTYENTLYFFIHEGYEQGILNIDVDQKSTIVQASK